MIVIFSVDLHVSSLPPLHLSPPPPPPPATAATTEIYGCTQSNLLCVSSREIHSCMELLCQENVVLHLIA